MSFKDILTIFQNIRKVIRPVIILLKKPIFISNFVSWKYITVLWLSANLAYKYN